MSVGPVAIPAGVDVSVKARLDADGTPILQVRISESSPNIVTFDLIVDHNINGQKLGLPKALPVNVFVNGGLAIPGFEYGDKFVASLTRGTYTFTVELLDGTPLPSMTVGPVFIDAGATVIAKARLIDRIPVIGVTVK